MPVNRLKAFLEEHQVRYVAMSHSSAYTAQGLGKDGHDQGGRRDKNGRPPCYL
jgi:hypothetical protein